MEVFPMGDFLPDSSAGTFLLYCSPKMNGYGQDIPSTVAFLLFETQQSIAGW
jgi:hypothetical protein